MPSSHEQKEFTNPMTPERWAELRALVETAMAMPTGERVSFLRSNLADDTMLHEAEQLLGFEAEASAMFSVDGWKQRSQMGAGEANLDGATLGSYRLIRELGRGGMGTVYLAERSDGLYQQRVALKVMQEGIVTPRLVERFRDERQILARLSHPGIARLLDGGVMPDGRPYLVMEFVDGIPVDRYCDENKLSIEARLQLFLKVAEAVQAAHQQLILHLDLKPANILVTQAGDPFLLDFGIARILTEADAGSRMAEMTMRLMTPRYASPEQAGGTPLGVGSDVFSLATLLYRLLTGKLPYGIEEATPLEAARMIREAAPMLPSDAAAPDDRATLRGDLDLILLQGLRKEPERRYPTVAALADDVRRYLSVEPVLAHSDSAGYRAGKFLRRNRLLVATSVAASIVLIGSVAAVLRSAAIARRDRATAERRLTDVRALAHSYIYDLIPALNDISGTLVVRKQMVTNAVGYLTAMSKEQASDPDFDKELASGFYTMGLIQGNAHTPSLGDRRGAMSSYVSALAIERRIEARNPTDILGRGRITVLLNLIATLHEAEGDIVGGMKLRDEAWQMSQSVLQGPKSTRFMQIANGTYLKSMDMYGDAQWNMADPEQALVWIMRSEDVVHQFGAANPKFLKVPNYISELVYVEYTKANVLNALGREDEATTIYEDMLKYMDTSTGKDRVTIEVRRMLHAAYGRMLFDRGDIKRAIEVSEVARPAEHHEANEAGDEVWTNLSVADEKAWAAMLDVRSGKTAEGRAQMRECLDLYHRLRKIAPDLMWTTSLLAYHLVDFAEMKETPAVEAKAMLTEAVQLSHAYAAGHADVLSAQLLEAQAHVALATLAARAGNSADASAESAQAQALLQPIVLARPKLVAAHTLMARAKQTQN